jgi:hypothetical protein
MIVFVTDMFQFLTHFFSARAAAGERLAPKAASWSKMDYTSLSIAIGQAFIACNSGKNAPAEPFRKKIPLRLSFPLLGKNSKKHMAA